MVMQLNILKQPHIVRPPIMRSYPHIVRQANRMRHPHMVKKPHNYCEAASYIKKKVIGH